MNNNFNNNATGNNNNNFGGKITMTNGTLKTMETFAATIKRCVELSLGEDYEVTVQEARKNNGVLLTGITIKEKNSKVAPMIYLEGAFESYLKGRSLAAICTDVIRVYKENNDIGTFDASELMDYENIKDKVCYRLINQERNMDFLEGIPHIKFHDLAIIFYLEIFKNTESTGTLTVTNELMDVWKKDAFAIIKDAVRNTENLLEGVVVHMADLLAELSNKLFPDGEAVYYDISPRDMFPLYVASNKTRANGAAVMLYSNFLEDFAEEIGNSFYILPSSIHELIFVPDHPHMDIEYFKSMVKEINIMEVAPQEVLSDNVYYYDRETGLLTVM